MKIGIIKERKAKVDNRVPLTPKQCMSIMAKYDDLEIYLEPSDIRCFKDDEYAESGVKVTDDMVQCDVLIGVKEVPVDELIADKTYFFFSHTIKKQPYNQKLLKTLVDKNIRMIDYECVTYEDGNRVLGFGHWAGIVGAHNGLLNYGLKTGQYELRPAHSFFDYKELKNYYDMVTIPGMRIAITGSGKVSQGAKEVMELILADEADRDQMDQRQGQLCYSTFPIENLYEDQNFNFERSDFFQNPENYRCVFRDYTSSYEMLINGIYWKEGIDPLFDESDISEDIWSIQTIADVTCDEKGSVPINLGSSDIAHPSYGVDRSSYQKVEAALPFEQSVDVMAVDNLPNELPRDASAEFGTKMSEIVIPELLKPESIILNNGTICRDGALTARFAYLQDYYEGE